MTDSSRSALTDLHIPASSLPWRAFFPGVDFKLLRTSAETGTFTLLLRTLAGASLPKHRHLGAGEYYMVSGKMLVRGGREGGGLTATTGDWGYEPLGIVHDSTEFPEVSVLLFTNHGPIQFLDEHDNTVAILDCQQVQLMAEGPVVD
jgi:anti-sigma factor ChrR (cupin superfamily)